jgi:Cytochrome c.
MKKSLAVASIAACTALFAIFCNEPVQQTQIAAATTISPDSLVKRGAYLVGMMGCTDCHSPKLMGPHGPYSDPDRLLSGHPADMPIAKYDTGTARNWVLFNFMQTAIVGPWGTTFAANITSDSTGIGSWTEEQFFKAMREGKYKGLDNSRPILPPMPWQEYAKASDEDLKAIFAYLKSTKPVKNVVPAAIVNMPPR